MDDERGLTDDELEAERQALADQVVKRHRPMMFFSPARYRREDHSGELADAVRTIATRDGFRDGNAAALVDAMCSSELIDIVAEAAEVLASRRVHQAIQDGIGIAGFVGKDERLPIKKELATAIDSAFLLLSDALVAVNRGDLAFLEMGQTEVAEVTRTRKIGELVKDGEIGMDEAMSQLAEAFGELLPTADAHNGFRPWNPDMVADWSTCYASSTQCDVALFLLNVWNPASFAGECPWPEWRPMETLRKLEDRHMNVIRAWFQAPFLP